MCFSSDRLLHRLAPLILVGLARANKNGRSPEPAVRGTFTFLMNSSADPFSDPQAVARYADGPPRLVPGFVHLQRMVTVLLAERVPRDGRVLVVGAGGGL